MFIYNFSKQILLSVIILYLVFSCNIKIEAQLIPEFHSTFHSIGMYWKPTTANATIDCTVKYKELGSSTWLAGMNLWVNPNIHTNLIEHS